MRLFPRMPPDDSKRYNILFKKTLRVILKDAQLFRKDARLFEKRARLFKKLPCVYDRHTNKRRLYVYFSNENQDATARFCTRIQASPSKADEQGVSGKR